MTKNIAHRGFSSEYPENTMLAFRKAVEAGCDGIELDVQLTRDGVPVVVHDERIKRTTNRAGLVKDFTAEEIRRFDASNGFDGSFGINPIPTLREYFQYIKDQDVFTNMELKNGIFRYEGMEEKVVALIREFGISEKVMFSSFNHQSMLLCKQLAPSIPCAFLTSCWQIEAGAYAEKNGVEFINPHFPFLTEENLREMNRHRIGAQVWTVDDVEIMERLVRLDVYAVITNRPDALKKVLGHKAAATV